MRNGGLRARLVALGGLVAIVGGVMLVLFAAGVLGGQGGGTTGAVVLDPPRLTAQEELSVAPRVGSLAPDFELSDYDGERVRLSDFRGKPVYVNFWATWCVPCQRELPDMRELLDRHADELTVFAINRGESLNLARDYFRRIEKLDGEPGISFTVNGLDPDDTLYDAYRGLGMPVSVFIDANGVVVKVYNGQIDLPTMEESLSLAVESAPAENGATNGSVGY